MTSHTLPAPDGDEILRRVRAARPDTDRVVAALMAGEGPDILAAVLTGPQVTASTGGRGARTRRRAWTAAAAALLSVAAGTGVAAAGGVLPFGFSDFAGHFSGWRFSDGNRGPSVDPGTATRVGTLPGPAGTTYTLVAAHAVSDPAYECLVALYETSTSLQHALPDDATEASGNGCRRMPVTGAFTALGADAAAWHTWSVSISAGQAVTATVTTADGTVYPTLRYEGAFYGWIPAGRPGERAAVATGYDATGRPIAHADL